MSAIKITTIDPEYSSKKQGLNRPEKSDAAKSPWTEKKLASTTKSELKSQEKFHQRMNKSRETSLEDRNRHERSTPLKSITKTTINTIKKHITESNMPTAVKSMSKFNTNTKEKNEPENDCSNANIKTASGSKQSEANNNSDESNV
jgi:hypothetical protein